jgi:hypothetical protein
MLTVSLDIVKVNLDILRGSIYTEIQRDTNRFESKIVDLESRSMRENIMFFGKEADNDTCATVVRTFWAEVLGITDPSLIVIDRARRIGRTLTSAFGSQRIRPIVVKYNRFGDREMMRECGYIYKDKIKDGNYGVNDQYPREMLETRKSFTQLWTVRGANELPG